MMQNHKIKNEHKQIDLIKNQVVAELWISLQVVAFLSVLVFHTACLKNVVEAMDLQSATYLNAYDWC